MAPPIKPGMEPYVRQNVNAPIVEVTKQPEKSQTVTRPPVRSTAPPVDSFTPAKPVKEVASKPTNKTLIEKANEIADGLLDLGSNNAKLAEFAVAIKKDTADGVINNGMELLRIALEMESSIPNIPKEFIDEIVDLSNKARKVTPDSDLASTVYKDIRTFCFTGSEYIFDIRVGSDGTVNISPRNGYMKNGVLRSFLDYEAYPQETAFAHKLSKIKTLDQLRTYLKDEKAENEYLNWKAKEAPEPSSFDGPYISI